MRIGPAGRPQLRMGFQAVGFIMGVCKGMCMILAWACARISCRHSGWVRVILFRC